MTKTELKITGMSHLRCVKTVVAVLPTLDSIQQTKVNPRKVASVSLSFISGILIAFFSIVGCSDMPYTGSMMTTDDIDQYIVSPNDELVCIQNGTDSECLTLIPKDTEKADSIINGPIIHIYPERLVYVFYHEGEKIVQAEKVMDTTEIVETLTEPKEDPPAPTNEPASDTAGDDPNANNTSDDTQQQPQTPPNGGTQQSITPQQQPLPPPPPTSGATGASDDSNANHNSDDTQQPQTPPNGGTQQPITPPPPPPPTPTPTINSSGDTGTVGNDPADDNNSDDTPPPPPQQPQTPPNGGTQQPITPPPPPPQQQPSPGPRHYTPNAVYSDDEGQWSVTIYYPNNYKGPRGENEEGFGFDISSPNGDRDEGTPTHNGVRFRITIGEGMLHVTVTWDPNKDNWEPHTDPPPKHYLIQARPGGTHRISVTME